MADRDLRDILRAALGAALAETGPPDPCPAPDRLLDAYYGRLTTEERRAIVDHLGRCAACSEAWPLAAHTPPPAVDRDKGPR